MGGKVIKSVRPLHQYELKSVFEWVQQNILPLLGLTEKDVSPIGSYGKKSDNDTSGDLDIAISSNIFINEGLNFSDISTSINLILNEAGYDTALLKGFDQVSLKAPIIKETNKGPIINGYAQVDLMPVLDLKWAKFMYHSPNLKEGDSKYKGAVRNALLMAIISESTKEITKLNEGKAEEYNSLAIRFPTGVWNIKRSFMGKRGNIVKKGTVLESEFITNDPQDVIDLSLGEGYVIDTVNSFETIWEVIHRKDFIHKKRLNEIMSKFKVNLKSMRMETPKEAIKKYPNIFEDYPAPPKNKNIYSKVKYQVKKLLNDNFDDKEFNYWYKKIYKKDPNINSLVYLIYSKMDNLNEEVVGMAGDAFDPVTLIKNPKTIKRLDSWIKGILDVNGNLYVEDIREDWLHKDMAKHLKNIGAIYYIGDFYDNLDKFVPVYRLKDSNEFALGEATPKDKNFNTIEIINKANNKNPQYKFYNKFYDEFTNYKETIYANNY